MNYSFRKKNKTVKYIVIHYTGMKSLKKAYLRLMIQSEPRFKEIITEQFVDINRGFDAIFDSAIIQNDRLLGGQRIFDRNIDVFEVAQNVMARYSNHNTALNKKWRFDISYSIFWGSF